MHHKYCRLYTMLISISSKLQIKNVAILTLLRLHATDILTTTCDTVRQDTQS